MTRLLAPGVLRAHPAVIVLNLSLLALFPLAWQAPLTSAALGTQGMFDLLPGWAGEQLLALGIFRLKEVSILSGIASLWETDRALALIVAGLAMAAPVLKTVVLLAVQIGRAPGNLLPALGWLGKLAMADVFLIALFVVVFKGVNLGRIEVEWGTHLFAFCVLASLAASLLTRTDARGAAG